MRLTHLGPNTNCIRQPALCCGAPSELNVFKCCQAIYFHKVERHPHCFSDRSLCILTLPVELYKIPLSMYPLNLLHSPFLFRLAFFICCVLHFEPLHTECTSSFIMTSGSAVNHIKRVNIIVRNPELAKFRGNNCTCSRVPNQTRTEPLLFPLPKPNLC